MSQLIKEYTNNRYKFTEKKIELFHLDNLLTQVCRRALQVFLMPLRSFWSSHNTSRGDRVYLEHQAASESYALGMALNKDSVPKYITHKSNACCYTTE